ncbi:MAG: glucuronate isomerase [Clostridia bacterium]|nr:glucuronate isomerase [Clostridia bacterium]
MDAFLLENRTARRLYAEVRDLPIYDYHCHLSPREIYLDEPATDICELWLAGDHYKWRLMRACGCDERLVTGYADPGEKFRAYAAACETAAGSPLPVWNRMELSRFFGIDTPLTEKTADDVRRRANAYIREHRLSPRKLIESSNVRFIATTDDAADTLPWHEKLAESGFGVKVTPSFRYDKLLSITAPGYAAYITALSEATGVKVVDLETLDEALERQLDRFCRLGCAFSDVGIPDFPDRIAPDEEADATFRAALAGEPIDRAAYLGWLGNRMVWLGERFYRRRMVMQMHLCVCRNANSTLYETLGPDAGGDCIGDELPTRDVVRLLDGICRACGGDMPEVILYALHPGMSAKLATIGGCFPHVRSGAAWWYCDHRRGIREQLQNVAEVAHMGRFPGMLTDSRSFLSYARHDYFRRILCTLLGEMAGREELSPDAARRVVADLSAGNIRRLLASLPQVGMSEE